MRIYISLIASVFIFCTLSAQKPWPVPQGGAIDSVPLGFFFSQGRPSTISPDGYETWGLYDMDGDGDEDLVVAAEMVNGVPRSFGLGSSPFWKVFLNTDSSFSSQALNWPVPSGGTILNGNALGFNSFRGFGSEQGSEVWSLLDIDGNGRPDLVVHAAADSALPLTPSVFDVGGSPYWKVYVNTGSAFSSTATNWSVPSGGIVGSGLNYGFHDQSSFTIFNFSDSSSLAWFMDDLTGDGMPDLVVSGLYDGTQFDVLGGVSNTHWDVYPATASGFASSPLTWSVPAKNSTNAALAQGYCYLAYHSGLSGILGTHDFHLEDIDDDGRRDLVVTGEVLDSIPLNFGLPSNPRWRVYLNTGSGFNTNVLTWTLPAGGAKQFNRDQGFFSRYLSPFGAVDQGSENWFTEDLNGDGRKDLVRSAESSGSYLSTFGAQPATYWKVHFNTGSGYSTNAQNWTLPTGGIIGPADTLGFIFSSIFTFDGQNGSENWDLKDLNADGLPDLVVTGEKANGKLAVFSPTSNPYWKVWYNDGSQFTNTPPVFREKELGGVSLYPNPSQGRFQLVLQEQIASSVCVRDLMGRLMWEGRGGAHQYTVDLSGVAAGVYLLQVETEGKQLIRRIVIE